MATQQPKYKLVGQIGDRDPIAYGGGFVYVDETGAYDPHLEYIEPGEDESKPVTIYRMDLEPPRFKTLRSAEGPTSYVWRREWFAEAERIEGCATSNGIKPFSLLRALASKDPIKRAWAYGELFSYVGVHEFDQYPLTMPEWEARNRYASELGMKPVTEFSVDTPDDEREDVYELIAPDKLVEIMDEDDLIAAAQMFAEYEVDTVERAKECLNYHVAYGGTAKDLKRRFFY